MEEIIKRLNQIDEKLENLLSKLSPQGDHNGH
jgi:tetrahydromethanopterin S-methyltransferase subunit G